MKCGMFGPLNNSGIMANQVPKIQDNYILSPCEISYKPNRTQCFYYFLIQKPTQNINQSTLIPPNPVQT